MEDQEKEDWVSLYQSALVELEQAKITRRISAAREAILARMEILRALPGPHTEERRAIEDALRALAFLQREEARFDAEAERRVVEESLEKLRSVGHTIQRLRRKAGPRMKPKHIGVVLAVALVFALSSSALGGSKYKVLHEFGGARTGLSPPVRFLLTKREACTGAPTSAERESAATTAAV